MLCRFNLASREVETENGKILRATDPDYNFGATVANEKVCFAFFHNDSSLREGDKHITIVALPSCANPQRYYILSTHVGHIFQLIRAVTLMYAHV